MNNHQLNLFSSLFTPFALSVLSSTLLVTPHVHLAFSKPLRWRLLFICFHKFSNENHESIKQRDNYGVLVVPASTFPSFLLKFFHSPAEGILLCLFFHFDWQALFGVCRLCNWACRAAITSSHQSSPFRLHPMACCSPKTCLLWQHTPFACDRMCVFICVCVGVCMRMCAVELQCHVNVFPEHVSLCACMCVHSCLVSFCLCACVVSVYVHHCLYVIVSVYECVCMKERKRGGERESKR